MPGLTRFSPYCFQHQGKANPAIQTSWSNMSQNQKSHVMLRGFEGNQIKQLTNTRTLLHHCG
jgi:hypothetical protein